MANPVINSSSAETQSKLMALAALPPNDSKSPGLRLLSPLLENILQGSPLSAEREFSSRSPDLYSASSTIDSIDDSFASSPFESNIIRPLRKSFKHLLILKSLFEAEADVLIGPKDKIKRVRQQISDLEAHAVEMKEFVNEMLKGKVVISPVPIPSPTLSDSEASRQETLTIPMLVHELRTPLHNIIGNLELFKKDISKHQEYIVALRDSLFHLAKLAMSVENNSPLTVDSKPVLLKDLMQSVLNKTKAYDADIKLQFNQGFKDELVVNCDSLKLSQALINLISNAVKYSPKPGGTVTIDVQSKETDNKVSLLFSVKDEGPGMSHELQSRLFRAYSTGDKPANTGKESTGLGLCISQKFIELMGGKISVQSELKKGSAFSFPLELDKSTLAINEIVPSPAPLLTKSEKRSVAVRFSERNTRVLAADDSSSTQKMLKNLFKSAKRKGDDEENCSVAASGEEAFAAFVKNPQYEVCVLDQNMDPDGLTGWQTAMKIHGYAKECKIKAPSFIIVSGQSEADNKELIESAPEELEEFAKRVAFLGKGCGNSALVAKINELVTAQRCLNT